MSENAEAAPVLLGSHVLAAARAHEAQRPSPASSGSAVIDEKALEGGFRHGEITSIAGTSGTGKTLIAYHAIASHLLKHEFGEVALVDSTGSFSPLRLRDVLAFRLRARLERDMYRQSGYVYEKTPLDSEQTKEQLVAEATLMLDRVKVMRVFDIAGVVEAVGEVGQMIETSQRGSRETGEAFPNTRKDEIGDSEEELDDTEDLSGKHPSSSKNRANGEIGQLGMLIFDNITSVVSPVISKSQIQGQALLTSFMRSLHHLTCRHHLCTILINAAVALNASNNLEYQRRPEEHVSIFSSTLGKPALGRTFTYLVDTSIFMSAVPRTSQDASISFAVRDESFQKSLILEILKDTHGSREGRWAAFEIVDGVKLVPCHG